MQDLDQIKSNYDKRKSLPSDTLYSMLVPYRMYQHQERERKLLNLLRDKSINLSDAKVCELGCGAGAKLQELIRFGFDPANLYGIELIEDRYQKALHVLPNACSLYCGDASGVELQDGFFDIVYFSTVFSSILDDELRSKVAQRSWELLKPGGAILIYDFAFNNPSNPDVRALKSFEVTELYPMSLSIEKTRLTVAPPLSRKACKIFPQIYYLLCLIPLVKTHRLYWIEKSGLPGGL